MPRKPRKRARGSVVQRGASWWVRWREKGRRRSASFPDKDTAEKVLLRIIGDVAAGRGGLEVPRAPSPPLSKLATEWIERRQTTHRSWRDDASRWKCHLAPAFGSKLPDEVEVADLRRFVEGMILREMKPATIRLCIALFGSLYTDLVERGLAERNVVRALPRAVRRLMKPDGQFSPFLERPEDIRRLFLALEQPFGTMYAVGVLAGLRPGEVLALEWGDIDLDARRIVVQRQARNGRVGPPKSGKTRVVPLPDTLAKILAEWRLLTGPTGQLFRPAPAKGGGQPGKPARFINLHTVHKALRVALAACELPEALTLYATSRHTFAAHFVLAGGSLSALRDILGHHSATVTERYGRLRADTAWSGALPILTVDLSRPEGEVIDMATRRGEIGAGGFKVGSRGVDEAETDDVSTGSI
jgi:integrase